MTDGHLFNQMKQTKTKKTLWYFMQEISRLFIENTSNFIRMEKEELCRKCNPITSKYLIIQIDHAKQILSFVNPLLKKI